MDPDAIESQVDQLIKEVLLELYGESQLDQEVRMPALTAVCEEGTCPVSMGCGREARCQHGCRHALVHLLSIGMQAPACGGYHC